MNKRVVFWVIFLLIAAYDLLFLTLSYDHLESIKTFNFDPTPNLILWSFVVTAILGILLYIQKDFLSKLSQSENIKSYTRSFLIFGILIISSFLIKSESVNEISFYTYLLATPVFLYLGFKKYFSGRNEISRKSELFLTGLIPISLCAGMSTLLNLSSLDNKWGSDLSEVQHFIEKIETSNHDQADMCSDKLHDLFMKGKKPLRFLIMKPCSEAIIKSYKISKSVRETVTAFYYFKRAYDILPNRYYGNHLACFHAEMDQKQEALLLTEKYKSADLKNQIQENGRCALFAARAIAKAQDERDEIEKERIEREQMIAKCVSGTDPDFCLNHAKSPPINPEDALKLVERACELKPTHKNCDHSFFHARMVGPAKEKEVLEKMLARCHANPLVCEVVGSYYGLQQNQPELTLKYTKRYFDHAGSGSYPVMLYHLKKDSKLLFETSYKACQLNNSDCASIVRGLYKHPQYAQAFDLTVQDCLTKPSTRMASSCFTVAETYLVKKDYISARKYLEKDCETNGYGCVMLLGFEELDITSKKNFALQACSEKVRGFNLFDEKEDINLKEICKNGKSPDEVYEKLQVLGNRIISNFKK